MYHFLGEAKVAFLRRYGIGVLAYLDDSFLTNYVSTHGGPPRVQWLAAAEATSVAMLVSYFCGYLLSITKCDLKPSTLQKYLGIWCASETATFRVPPVLDQAAARSLLVAPRGAPGVCQWPCPREGSLRPWRYPSWAMRAVEVDFRPASAR